jgi:putative ABC transport system permease protein
MSALGSDIIYVGRWPWMDEGGEYKWWEFWRRPSMSPKELRAVQENVSGAQYATLCFTKRGLVVKHQDQELEGISGYAVTDYFDKVQNIEIAQGRYLSGSELLGGSNVAVIGDEVYHELFGNTNAIGKTVSYLGRQFLVVGIMKKVGQDMAGFNFDRGVVFSYYAASSLLDTRSLNNDPNLIIKVADGRSPEDVKYEVEGALRRERKIKPGQKNDFAMNQLSEVSARLDMIFDSINLIGAIIGAFSLVVGAFGIANIMFVTVKERTKQIGLYTYRVSDGSYHTLYSRWIDWYFYRVITKSCTHLRCRFPCNTFAQKLFSRHRNIRIGWYTCRVYSGTCCFQIKPCSGYTFKLTT